MTRTEYDKIREYLLANEYIDEGDDRFVKRNTNTSIRIDVFIACDGIYLDSTMYSHNQIDCDTFSMKIMRLTSSYNTFLSFLNEYDFFVETFIKFNSRVFN